MLNIGEGSSKYVTFWSADCKEKYADVKMASSAKDKDGNYENSNWFARFVGHANNKVNQLNEKDKIEITQGGIKKYYDKENKKEYYNVVVFDFEMMDGQKTATIKASAQVEDDFDDDDIPF